mmetsp:Transcript_26819/g.63038  ORF Transcript_26819/g.63038 Transcript_26819/m.63038 type:complete len:746 (-) Transcript_26819:29-2266(-)
MTLLKTRSIDGNGGSKDGSEGGFKDASQARPKSTTSKSKPMSGEKRSKRQYLKSRPEERDSDFLDSKMATIGASATTTLTTTKCSAISTQNQTPGGEIRSSLPRLLVQGTLHLACIVLYLIPILTSNEFAGPTLDEAHIMAGDIHKDIHDPNATWRQIFSNDYWGRPMNSASSHKSWRPLTILSFRYLKGPYMDLATQSLQQLTIHRFVNIVSHATAGELVGQLATQLFLPSSMNKNNDHQHAMWLQFITKILFCLHPTHVEVTVNAANRGHVLALLLGLILCFPGAEPDHPESDSTKVRRRPLKITTPFWLFFTALVAGYLSSETFLFMIPGAMVTMTVITFNDANAERIESKENSKDEGSSDDKKSLRLRQFIIDYLHAMLHIAPRLVLLAISTAVYYGGRLYFDTFDIPTGLIRPAESPYFAFEGVRRFKNYLYVVTIHLGKQWGLVLPKDFGGDPIGFSHEYGFDCIPEVNGWTDERFVFGVGFHLVFAMMVSILLIFHNPRRYFGLVAIHWSWTLFTLLPISGIHKVGTFVSDRMVVPASAIASLWIGKIIHSYATVWFWKKGSPFQYFRPLQVVFVIWWIGFSYTTIHNRALEWMDSISLMTSSLKTCPRYAKVHMETSKIYSGLYPSLLDLKKARYHLDTAREIDPELCDLHKQYVLLGIREGKFHEVEQEITQALLCPFTSSGMEPYWQQYWQQALSSAPPGTPQHDDIKRRYDREMTIVQAAILKERQEADHQRYG